MRNSQPAEHESSKGNKLHSSRRIVFRIIANDRSDGNVNAIITSFEINNKYAGKLTVEMVARYRDNSWKVPKGKCVIERIIGRRAFKREKASSATTQKGICLCDAEDRETERTYPSSFQMRCQLLPLLNSHLVAKAHAFVPSAVLASRKMTERRRPRCTISPPNLLPEGNSSCV